MYTVLVILIVILAVLMCLIVLIQESKGGGLASSFSASNQIMGVRKTTDVIEKLTWGLAAAMVVLSVASVFFIPKVSTVESAMMKAATEQKAVISNNPPGFGASQTQQSAPAQNAPAQQAPAPAAQPAQ
ncbi:MAG: preprotein translocase subunit SecG [Paraprevotella sp.]|nr:preprotein translocase subunit SecG [Paraprevotella sp.]